MKNIFRALEIIDEANLNPNEVMMLNCILVRLNKNYWKPAAISGAVLGRGMGKDTFLKERKYLTDNGWIEMRPGQWKTALPIYRLGPRFEDMRDKTKQMRNRDDIKKLVIEIDRQYPAFSDFCARYKWDRAIELFKSEHPELAALEWPVDFIGDPANREQAHEMLVKLHKKKKALNKKPERFAPPLGVWDTFYVFVDMWRLSYPKKASRTVIMNAAKDFIRGKEEWTHEQVKDLQDTITAHTSAYVSSFGDDTRFMVSPINYFAAEKWQEKVSVKRDKTDVNCKMAGSPVKPNMPKITMIKAN